MKTKVLSILVFLAVVSFAGHQHGFAKEPLKLKVGKEGARITLIEGTAKVLSPGHKDWRSLRLHDVLNQGDEIFTGPRSRLEINMLDGSRVRFAEKTRFIMQRAALVDEKKETNVRVHMAVGRSWANVIRRITGRSVFELSCNNAVAGVRGTVYRMNVHEDNSALVKVYEGSVEVSRWTGQPAEDSVPLGEPKKVAGPTPIPGPKAISMEEWTYLIKSMQQIRINADGTTEKPQSFDAKEDRDDWVRWNQSRDANEAKPARDDASEG